MIGPFQLTEYAIGAEDTPVTLTALFSGNQSVWKAGRTMGQMILYVTYTPETGQTDRQLKVRVEMGPKNDDLYQITKAEDISGTPTELLSRPYDIRLDGAVGGTVYKRRVSIPVADKWTRISVKEDGVANFGTALIRKTITSRA